MSYPSFAIVLYSLSIGLFLLGLRRVYRHKHSRFAKVINVTQFLAYGFLSIAVALWATQLTQFSRAMLEKPLMDLSIKQLNATPVSTNTNYVQYGVTLTYLNGRTQYYVVQGDEWQLDARILRWPKWFAQLGMMPGYRFERLAGRYNNIEYAKTAQRTIYALSSTSSQWLTPVQNTMMQFTNNVGLTDVYGSAVYQPLADEAHYRIYLTYHGLTSSPVNQQAKNAVQRWQ